MYIHIRFNRVSIMVNYIIELAQISSHLNRSHSFIMNSQFPILVGKAEGWIFNILSAYLSIYWHEGCLKSEVK